MAEPTVFQTPNLYGPAQSFGLTNRYDYKGLDPELALAERAADQRQLIANAILNQSSVPRRGKMVGRLYQKAHWAEGLGQLGEAAAGMYLSNKIQEDRAKAEDKSQKGQAAELAAYREAIDPRAATDAEMVPNIRGANAGKIAEAMLAQSGVAPLKGQYAPQAPGAYQVAQFDQPRAEVDPAVQAQAAAQADEQAAAQAAYAVNPNAGGYNMNNAPEAVMNPAPAPAAMTRPEVPSVDLAQQAGMLERPAQAAFTPTPQQERAAIAPLRTSQYAANREYGRDELTRLRDEQTQRNVDQARTDALELRKSEVTYQDLGNKVAVMRRGEIIGYLPKGAAPKEITYLDTGSTLVPRNEQGITGGAPIVKTPTPGEATTALNQVIRFNPITGKAELNPDYVEGKKDIARAGANNTLIKTENYVPASVEAQKQFMQNVAKQNELLSSIPATLKNLDAAKALIPGAKDFMGTGGPQILNVVKFFNNRLGTNIDIKGITNAEELRSRLFNNILNDLKKLDAQPSQQQQNTLSDALGNLTTDPNALPKVLDAYEDILRSKVSIYNDMIDSSQTRGIKFPFDVHIVMPPPGFADTGNKDENGNMIVRKRGVNGGKDEYQVYQRGK